MIDMNSKALVMKLIKMPEMKNWIIHMHGLMIWTGPFQPIEICLLYTSDAADE